MKKEIPKEWVDITKTENFCKNYVLIKGNPYFMIFHFKSSFSVGIMKCNNFPLKTFNLFSLK
jgi:hypothetical protein